MASVLVIDESQQRAVEICTGLIQAGHQVSSVLPSALELITRIEEIKPDIILIETDSSSCEMLEHLGVKEIAYEAPRKLAMQRSQPLAKVAGNIVDMAKLLP